MCYIYLSILYNREKGFKMESLRAVPEPLPPALVKNRHPFTRHATTVGLLASWKMK